MLLLQALDREMSFQLTLCPSVCVNLWVSVLTAWGWRILGLVYWWKHLLLIVIIRYPGMWRPQRSTLDLFLHIWGLWFDQPSAFLTLGTHLNTPHGRWLKISVHTYTDMTWPWGGSKSQVSSRICSHPTERSMKWGVTGRTGLGPLSRFTRNYLFLSSLHGSY